MVRHGCSSIITRQPDVEIAGFEVMQAARGLYEAMTGNIPTPWTAWGCGYARPAKGGGSGLKSLDAIKQHLAELARGTVQD